MLKEQQRGGGGGRIRELPQWFPNVNMAIDVPVCSKQVRQVGVRGLQIFEPKRRLRVDQQEPQRHRGYAHTFLYKTTSQNPPFCYSSGRHTRA